MIKPKLIVVDTEKLITLLTSTFAGGYKLAKDNMPLDKQAINLGFRTLVMEGLIKNSHQKGQYDKTNSD